MWRIRLSQLALAVAVVLLVAALAIQEWFSALSMALVVASLALTLRHFQTQHPNR